VNELNLIFIFNHGPAVTSTDYFDTQRAQQGYFFASWNAGALRLLVPDNQLAAVAEMATAKNVAITRGRMAGREAYEILFDDETDTPFALTIDAENSDRHVGQESHGRHLDVHVYTRDGSAGVWPGRFRVAALPCLQPIDWLPKLKPRWRQA